MSVEMRREMRKHLWFLEMNQFETGHHTHKGSQIRHLVVERVIYRLKWLMRKFLGEWFDRMWGGVLYLPIIFAFGLNCNYPVRKVCGYVIWWIYYRCAEIHWRQEESEDNT